MADARVKCCHSLSPELPLPSNRAQGRQPIEVMCGPGVKIPAQRTNPAGCRVVRGSLFYLTVAVKICCRESVSDTGVGRIDAERGGEGGEVVLLVQQNLADGFGDGVLVE